MPQKLAAITSPPFSTAINLYPDTTNSLNKTIIGIHAGKFPASTSINIAANTSILSAKGSANFPNVVTKLFFLAIFPSKWSVYDAIIKIHHVPKKHVLTDVLLETLSIVAYKQPITRNEIEAIRGVSCEHVINKLVEYHLIKEVGRMNVPGKPILFGTTEEFLRNFGLVSLEELPIVKPEKIEDFKVEVEEEIQLKLDI